MQPSLDSNTMQQSRYPQYKEAMEKDGLREKEQTDGSQIPPFQTFVALYSFSSLATHSLFLSYYLVLLTCDASA